ncbi:CASP-like protein 1D1 [Hibiscus syriacus]|uniref:CASP-like protein n=1 Tax=Hibiscus syriacus TaxID=106335 RepID=A0A6A3CG67_HIBSY|nr:CASP-like protein 1D1 [Hibiscus syriacus]KAE8726358.1 CASP-like protein 1D1 [Hibiscus syriacus]
MASTDKPAVVSESPPKSEAVPPEAAADAALAKFAFDYSFVDVTARIFVFAAALCSVVVMVTSEQTEVVPVPGLPGVRLPLPAKFNHSPALIYFVAALSVTGLYSIITTLASVSVILKPVYSKTFLLAFAFLDVVFVGIVASATGAAGGVAYIGLKGNSHVGWTKICNVYSKFCRYNASSIALALFAAILLALLSMMSTFKLYKKIRD